MSSLYQLTDQYRSLEEAAYNDELDYDEFERLLLEINGEIEDKVDGYCKVIASIKADAAALKEEETRIAARRKDLENRIQTLRTALSVAMDAQGRDKIKTPLFTVYHVNHKKLEITDLDAVPDEYIKPHKRAETDVDKKALSAYILETGEILPYARMEVGRSLNIR